MFKENDIRPKDLLEGQKKAVEADIRTLLDRKSEFVEVACPACGGNDFVSKFEKNGFKYVECPKCLTFYMSPRPTLRILTAFLENSQNYAYWSKYIFPASEETRRMKIFSPRVDRVLGLCKKHRVSMDALLEVGAGFGTFCEELKGRKIFKRVVAIEPSPTLAAVCRKKGIETVESTIENIEFKHGKSFDLVVNFEVIEHLFSPREFVIACRKLLKPSGLFIITCPNGRGFDIKTLGPVSDTIDHEHLNYFNPESLAVLLTSCGFKVLESITPGVLDAELVRNKVIEGKFDIAGQPFLNEILVEEWDRLGSIFQDFLSFQGLSSNMWLVAKNC
ncbi:MAG: class I SAM-dependent methyltransferase [Patescibacteria group bacterium]